MRPSVLIALFSFVLASSADAGNRVAALQQLRAEAPQARVYAQSDQSGISRVYGTVLAVGDDPRRSADAFLQQHGAVLGVAHAELAAGRPLDGRLTQPVLYEPATGRYRFTLVYYEQTRAGLPVYGGEVRALVRNEADYPLVWVGASTRELGDFAVAPTLFARVDEAAAINAVTAASAHLTGFTRPELMIWAGTEAETVPPRLALVFEADNYAVNPDTPEKWLYVCDAQSGAVLHRESRIVFEVHGHVSGLATQGPAADMCADEVPTPLPWALVMAADGAATYTDAAGNFTLPYAGGPVEVSSFMEGLYFRVRDYAVDEETLVAQVTPPGPVDFLHNAANAEQYIRAQVNGYLQANLVRDYVLTYNPSYPVVSDDILFPVNVNRTGGYCPGNAWYDGSSINFCRTGMGSPNTAYQSVLFHEYGHHLVRTGGSGQGQYGEGMSDCIAMLYVDDPVLGYGFFGDCNGGLRNADNNYQYPCAGQIHDCGQLLSGAVWSTRNELIVTEPVEYLNILRALTINSILLHTGTLITPQITIDFLTLDDDDGNLQNGTPHYAEICAGFGAHNMGCQIAPGGVSVSPAGDFVAAGPPGGPFTPASRDYVVENLGSDPVTYWVTASQPWLALQNAGGTLGAGETAIVTVSITAAAAALGPATYFDVLTFEHSLDPADAVVLHARLDVGDAQLIYDWPLDSDPGWQTQGQWAFGVPTGGGGEHGSADPVSGATGAFVYGYNLAGDYDNGLAPQHLTVGPVNCDDLVDVTLRFQRWLGVGLPSFDRATLAASVDGFAWRTLWENTAEVADTAWVPQEFDLSWLADDEPQVWLRWTIGPTNDTWRYCGWNIDDVQIWARQRGPAVGACCHADGSCVMTIAAECSGLWQGDGALCTPNPCPQPSGACCWDNGICAVVQQADCLGTWLGAGAPCNPNPCPNAYGACCYPDGSCSVTLAPACTGMWRGLGTTCDPNPCPQPAGACCLPDGTCQIRTQANCSGSWMGMGASCSPNPCPPPVCRGDANCDGRVNAFDIDYFVAAMNDNRAAWEAMFGDTPVCPFENNDVNGDGYVNWRDIQPLIFRQNTLCP